MGVDLHFSGWHATLYVWELLAYVGAAVIAIAAVIVGVGRLTAAKPH